MHQVYEAFLECLADSVDERDLARAMSALARAFDLRCFAYLSLQSDGRSRPRLISNYPSGWTSHYLRHGYERIDPVVECARRSNEPFCWGRHFGRKGASRSQLRIFDEAVEFGIACGLTIPIHDQRGGMAAITFAADAADPAIRRVAARYEHALQLAGTCFHIQARRVLSTRCEVDGVSLTARKFECLQWAARGKSAWEIGCILGIKRRTAAFHLDNARRKLRVRTIAQAVVRLASNGRAID